MNPQNLNDFYKNRIDFGFRVRQMINNFYSGLNNHKIRPNPVSYQPRFQESKTIEMFAWTDDVSGKTIFMCGKEIRELFKKEDRD